MNPNDMTCEECRDELARMDGWTEEPAVVTDQAAIARAWWRWQRSIAARGL